ncbi:PAS domain S-box protein [Acetobacterium paludosum]|uniref:Circadian input-output histidine kinase CikA n=1 Tax=Acetobacterium paludosum TaxID=52693 RepID=A0A923KXS0_9FIRM|nr:PAS domain-containing hybrid sensor histidine kinase/response regulator [Acetobacterium paludosum]MBC3889713.1 PAS domain S-box protein [Acetobacterium paludosum]
MNKIKEQLESKDKAWLVSTLFSAGDAIMTSGLDGCVDFLNVMAVEILGRPSSELIGKPFTEAFEIYNHGENTPICFGKINHSIGLPSQSFYVRPDGEIKYLSARLSPIFSDSGEQIGNVIVFRDISKIIHAEELIKNERNNLKTIFQLMPTAMVITDINGIIRETNQAFLKIFGMDKCKVIGKGFGDAFGCVNSYEGGCNASSNCAFCRIRSAMNKVAEDEIAVKENSVPFKYIREGVEQLIFLNTSIMISIIEEKMEFVMTIEDITETIYYEKSLKDARNACMITLDSLPMMIFKIDKNHDCDFFNETLKSYLNIDKGSFLEALQMHMKPSEYIRLYQVFNEAFLMEKSFNIEVELSASDETYRIFRGMGNPYYEKNGEFAGIIGLFLDIHDERCAEELFRKSQQKYFSLFTNLDSSITYFKAVYDDNKTIIDAELIEMNQATEKLFCTSRNMVIGHRVTKTNFLDSEEISKLLKCFNKELYESKNINIEEYYSERLKRWVEASICSPEPDHIAVLTWDIDAKKQTEIKLKSAMERSDEANRAKSEFLANMSHEIRTPLNGIIGMIDLTMMESLSEEQQENLNTAKSCVHSLIDIINDILDFAKIEAGKLMIEPMSFNLIDMIEMTIKMHQNHAIERGLSLSVHYENVPKIFVIGDSRRLKQVLNNLLSNAIKFTNVGSVKLIVNQEVISEKTDQVMLHIDVKDTGIGIDPSKYSKLFKSFSQIDGSHTRKYGGTGIGLVITKQLTDMMEGKVSFISEFGLGSTFSVHIPMRTTNKIGVKLEESVPEAMFNGNKILLVEDDRVNQIVMCKMLKSFGIETDLAENGKEGVLLSGKNKYDLILMDVQMPVMDGIMATQIIRRKRELEDIEYSDFQKLDLLLNEATPIIALSAYALKGDEAIFRASGMDSYLSKPVDRNQMKSFLGEYLINKNTSELAIIRDRVERYHKNSNENSGKNENIPVTVDGRTRIEINQKITQLKALVMDRNFVMTEVVAHQLKQLFDEINAVGLKDLVFKLELAIRKDQLENIPEYLQRIEEIWLIMKQDKV